jgi:hypothetical protein
MDDLLRYPTPEPHPVPPYTPPDVRVQPPMVFVEPEWEYKHVARTLTEQEPLGEAELNELGAQGWELAGVLSDTRSAHFYFKRLTR